MARTPKIICLLAASALAFALSGCSSTTVNHSPNIEGKWCLVAYTDTGENNLSFENVCDTNNVANFENNENGFLAINSEAKAFKVERQNETYKLTSTDGDTVLYAVVNENNDQERDALIVSSGLDPNKRIVAIRYDENLPKTEISIPLSYADISTSTSSGGSGSESTYKKNGNSDSSDETDSSSNIPKKAPSTIGEKNALRTAKQYLSSMPFSAKGLKKQLEYEGFSSSEADCAVANCDADWYQQAAKMAKTYLNTMSFSRSGLIEQLEYEGFTHSQAEYGVSQAGY